MRTLPTEAFQYNRLKLTSTRFVQLQDWSQLCSHKTLVKTAEDSGWISSESVDFIEKGTVGSAVLTRTGNTSRFQLP